MHLPLGVSNSRFPFYFLNLFYLLMLTPFNWSHILPLSSAPFSFAFHFPSVLSVFVEFSLCANRILSSVRNHFYREAASRWHWSGGLISNTFRRARRTRTQPDTWIMDHTKDSTVVTVWLSAYLLSSLICWRVCAFVIAMWAAASPMLVCTHSGALLTDLW